jgi:pyrroline-5-carboxylate reductase
MSERIAILGAGRLGESLARGLLSSNWRAPDQIVATSRRPERLAELADRYGVTTTSDNRAAVEGAGLVVVAVKPQDMTAVLAEISAAITMEHTVLSVAAGIRTASIEAHLPTGSRVVRAMPNAPALVHEGIAGLCGGSHARDLDLDLATEALDHLGAVVRVAEDDMDAVTALSGSGPAYFALLAEAMIEAGLLLGLSRDVSTRLVVQTMFGSALLLRDERMHPVELREAVTSPGGTTTRAIQELERSGVRAAFLNAITAATERSRELASRVSD